MSETMVERVAMAMRKAYSSYGGDSALIPWEKSRACEEWLLCARAAIEAMREPAPLEVYPGVHAYAKVETKCRPVAFRAGWNAVLDAALSQSHPQSPNTADTP
jgi:hypothetical protein